MEKLPITAAGHAALIEELRRRQQEERPRIITMIAEARAHGDLSENAEYHSAKEQQSLNEGRIAELEDKIARADVIDLSKLSGKTIKFGATVTLVDEDTDEEKKYQIVGETEADVKSGRVSIISPIARACAANAASVGDENSALSATSSPICLRTRVIKRMPSSEWPPSTKKLSWRPTRSTPSICAQMPAMISSTGVAGGSYSARPSCAPPSGAGSALRSSLPLLVNGHARTSTYAVGTM